MKLAIEEITAEMAQEMLRRTEGTTQRPISQKLVERLTSAIMDNRWQTTHQAIAITDDGIVIDGRHRLTAIWRSGRTVEVWVARGADPSTFLAVDTGRARTPADLLHIAGHANTNVLAAITRNVIAAKRIRGTTLPWWGAANTVRPDEIVSFAERNQPELLNAAAVGTRIARQLGRVGLKTWIGSGAYLIRESTVPADLQNEFFERLGDGEMLAAGSPILALRRFVLLSFNLHNTRITPPVGMGVMIKAFNTWTSGGVTQVSVFRVGIEKFPGVTPWSETPAESRPLPSNSQSHR